MGDAVTGDSFEAHPTVSCAVDPCKVPGCGSQEENVSSTCRRLVFDVDPLGGGKAGAHV